MTLIVYLAIIPDSIWSPLNQFANNLALNHGYIELGFLCRIALCCLSYSEFML